MTTSTTMTTTTLMRMTAGWVGVGSCLAVTRVKLIAALSVGDW